MNIVSTFAIYAEPFDHPLNTMKTSRDVLSVVAGIHGVPESDILNRSQESWRVAIRNEFFYRASKLKGMSVCKLAGLYGYNHATLFRAIARHAFLNNLPKACGFNYIKAENGKRINSFTNYREKQAKEMRDIGKGKVKYELKECKRLCAKLKRFWKKKGYDIRAKPEFVQMKIKLRRNYIISSDLVKSVPEGYK